MEAQPFKSMAVKEAVNGSINLSFLLAVIMLISTYKPTWRQADLWTTAVHIREGSWLNITYFV